MNEIKTTKFFDAGKAIFTVHNNKNEHFTYKIRKGKDNKPYFVFLLTGPDNSTSYTYIGCYIPQQFCLKLTAKSKLLNDSRPVKVFNWAIKTVAENKELPVGYGIKHENKCCRCGRRLTTPESIDHGIGPECIKYIS